MDTNVGQTDIAASREAREQMDETLWWKPESGEGNRWKDNFIRILPPHINMEGKFYLGLPLHFDIGPTKAVVPCPRKGLQSPCPLCAEGFRLRDDGKEQEGNDLLPSWQGYMNVVLLDDSGAPAGKDPKVRVLSASRAILDELLDMMEQKLGDITHLETGHNINIRRKGEKFKTKYQVGAATDSSAFDYPELVAGLHDLTKISPYRPFEVLAGLLEGEARKDPFAPVEAPAEERPAISGPVKPAGGMSFDAPPPDNEDAEQQGTPSVPDPAAKPLTQEEGKEALRRSLEEGKS